MSKKNKNLVTLFGLIILMFGLVLFVLNFNQKENINDLKEPLLKIIKLNNLSPNEKAEKEITITFVGDIMLSRGVAKRIILNQDIHYPFKNVSEILKKSDIVFGNLESPIVDGPVVVSGEMRLRADPGIENALKAAGFKILSLANNHIGDFGENGVLQTIDLLNNAGIKYVGAGKDELEAYSPAYIESDGYTLAFLAYNDSDVVPAHYRASTDRAGSAFMEIPLMTQKVKEAKESADIVIVSMHSGTEYTDKINSRQRNFAHSAIDAGADIVVGHHPHVVQEVEIYKDKYILYSLGNFVFDQLTDETKEGVIVNVTFEKNNIKNIEYLPVYIENFSQPRLIKDKAHSLKVLSRLKLNTVQSGY